MAPYSQMLIGFKVSELNVSECFSKAPSQPLLGPPFVPDKIDKTENDVSRKEIEMLIRLVKMLDKKHQAFHSADYSDMGFDLYVYLKPKIADIKNTIMQLSEKHGKEYIKNILNSTTVF